MEIVGAAFGGEGDVADLGEFGAVVGGGDLNGLDAFLRGVSVLQRAVWRTLLVEMPSTEKLTMEELAPPSEMLPAESC